METVLLILDSVLPVLDSVPDVEIVPLVPKQVGDNDPNPPKGYTEFIGFEEEIW